MAGLFLRRLVISDNRSASIELKSKNLSNQNTGITLLGRLTFRSKPVLSAGQRPLRHDLQFWLSATRVPSHASSRKRFRNSKLSYLRNSVF